MDLPPAHFVKDEMQNRRLIVNGLFYQFTHVLIAFYYVQKFLQQSEASLFCKHIPGVIILLIDKKVSGYEAANLSNLGQSQKLCIIYHIHCNWSKCLTSPQLDVPMALTCSRCRCNLCLCCTHLHVSRFHHQHQYN